MRRRPRGTASEVRRPQGCHHEDWSISTTPRLRPDGFPVTMGGDVLGVGIDWSEEFHLVALGRLGDGVIEVVRVEHNPAAVEALMAKIAGRRFQTVNATSMMPTTRESRGSRGSASEVSRGPE